ncbi:hypothetical protein BT69DRAFT_1395165 [Atractiella rhizophila]|nr:hypothetical protein BT69DRAFT_1395165 [Atractiella rhizophila]
MDSLELQSTESAFITPLSPPERPEDANAQSYVWHEDALGHCSQEGGIFPYLHSWPRRETDKGTEVTYYDHFVKDLDLLPSNVKAAFWHDMIVWNSVDRPERTTQFVEDLRVFLRYMYPGRAPGPPTVQVEKVEPMDVDIIHLKCQDEVLLTFILLSSVMLQPANSLGPEDWETDTLDESNKIARNYISFLATLPADSNGHRFAAFMDFKSSVLFRGSYKFICTFEAHPYFQVFALMSEDLPASLEPLSPAVREILRRGRVFLRYMYPGRAPGPPTVQVEKVEPMDVDIIHLKCQDEVLLTFILLSSVMLQPANSLWSGDWETDTLDESNKIARNYISFLSTLPADSNGHRFAAFMDFKSSVLFRGSYKFICTFEAHPYFQVFALMSEVFSIKWDCSKYSNQTGPACFPRTLVSGCARDPATRVHIDLSPVLASSEHDLYEVQTGDPYLQHLFMYWHQLRMEEGERWLDNLTFVDTDITVASVLSTTTSHTIFPPLVLTADNPTLLWFQNILFQATSSTRRASPSFSALNVGDRIKLLSSIRSGPQLHGQTFLVGVEGEDSPFVLKIYDERLFPYPKWDMDYEAIDRLRRWPDAEASMRKEENAYSVLRLLQGSAIARSYGFYNVKLGDGTICRAHLMEYVEGPTLDRADVHILSDEEQDVFYVKAMVLIGAIFLLGIVHGDLEYEPHQVLCPPTAPGHSPDIVLLDFGMANEVHIDETTLLSEDAWDFHVTEDFANFSAMVSIALQPDASKRRGGAPAEIWEKLREMKWGYFDIDWKL